jgi:hypothetical protein
MSNTSVSLRASGSAGSRRLLHDIAVVGLAHGEGRPARERLEEALGVDVSRVVVRSSIEPPPTVLPGVEHPRAA